MKLQVTFVLDVPITAQEFADKFLCVVMDKGVPKTLVPSKLEVEELEYPEVDIEQL